MNSESSNSGYEERDVNAGKVSKLMGLLVCILILCCLVSAGYFFFLTYWVERVDGPIVSPLPRTERAFPKPRLQANPTKDLERLRMREEKVLASYRWVQREKGVVQIPIDRAMLLLAEKGVPVGDGAGGPTWQEMLQRRAQEGGEEAKVGDTREEAP